MSCHVGHVFRSCWLLHQRNLTNAIWFLANKASYLSSVQSHCIIDGEQQNPSYHWVEQVNCQYFFLFVYFFSVVNDVIFFYTQFKIWKPTRLLHAHNGYWWWWKWQRILCQLIPLFIPPLIVLKITTTIRNRVQVLMKKTLKRLLYTVWQPELLRQTLHGAT